MSSLPTRMNGRCLRFIDFLQFYSCTHIFAITSFQVRAIAIISHSHMPRTSTDCHRSLAAWDIALLSQTVMRHRKMYMCTFYDFANTLCDAFTSIDSFWFGAFLNLMLVFVHFPLWNLLWLVFNHYFSCLCIRIWSIIFTSGLAQSRLKMNTAQLPTRLLSWTLWYGIWAN